MVNPCLNSECRDSRHTWIWDQKITVFKQSSSGLFTGTVFQDPGSMHRSPEFKESISGFSKVDMYIKGFRPVLTSLWSSRKFPRRPKWCGAAEISVVSGTSPPPLAAVPATSPPLKFPRDVKFQSKTTIFFANLLCIYKWHQFKMFAFVVGFHSKPNLTYEVGFHKVNLPMWWAFNGKPYLCFGLS